MCLFQSFFSISSWDCKKCKRDIIGLTNGYASESGSKDIINTVQGDLFCKSRLLNLGSEENVQECQDFMQTFIPAALKSIAEQVKEYSHYHCYNLFDEICILED